MIVPRIAWFYWSGGPLSWLRRQSIISFQRFHPEWTVMLGSPEANDGHSGRLCAPPGVQVVADLVSDARLAPAARSDVWRWSVLATRGGLYADTDVVFFRSVEPLLQGENDAWITLDMGTPIWPSFQTRKSKAIGNVSIGVLASVPGSVFFTRLLNLARAKCPEDDYQSHGTRLIAPHWEEISASVEIGRLPARSFYRGSSNHQVQPLWTESGKFSPHEYGVHWYGGSVVSAPYEHVKSVAELPQCWVRKALEFNGGEV